MASFFSPYFFLPLNTDCPAFWNVVIGDQRNFADAVNIYIEKKLEEHSRQCQPNGRPYRHEKRDNPQNEQNVLVLTKAHAEPRHGDDCGHRKYHHRTDQRQSEDLLLRQKSLRIWSTVETKPPRERTGDCGAGASGTVRHVHRRDESPRRAEPTGAIGWMARGDGEAGATRRSKDPVPTELRSPGSGKSKC
jgi:hypothetical protein